MIETKKVLGRVCEIIEDRKGENLVILDISKISSFTDFFVLCEGFNQRQNQAISDAIREKLKAEFDLFPSHIEGYADAEWILMDYMDFIVHILSPQARNFYKLERLWSDGEEIEKKALIA